MPLVNYAETILDIARRGKLPARPPSPLAAGQMRHRQRLRYERWAKPRLSGLDCISHRTST